MKRILITGGTGFFGKSMLDYRKRHADIDWPEWLILSRNPDKFISAYPNLSRQAGLSFVAGDVRDFKIGGIRLDGIIHAAALLDPSWSDDEILSVALEGTEHVVDVAREAHCSKILFTSSGAVYGRLSAPVSETAMLEPITPYGKAKLGAEQLLLMSGLDVKIARCFAFVGKYLDRTIYYAIGNFIRDALAGRDIAISGDGTQMRSYMYVDDLVEWLFSIFDHGASGRPYNVGSPDAISIRDIAQTVVSTIQSNNQTISNLKILGAPVLGAVNYYVPVVDRAVKELGLSLKYNLIDAIKESAK